MNRAQLFSYLFLTGFSVIAFACQGGEGGKGGTGGKGGSVVIVNQNGGAGLNGKNGKSGMNGCPGGTQAAPDGHFYLRGTHEQCNPFHAKKQKSQASASLIEST
ncbi:hypothetical protein [Klebsiella michiganensis]|uniref:hypothetical protein n=1 Tax=Klebsiella michiganensis TaxID=1134687 RepID=UPI00090059A5|nr:hypothetical protein [Klebsiella michiganensis]